ncbi:MAG TPA: GNAT family N-acetyltransferase [Xanthomonadales bacterium]|jgi:GNAT superfamily N-acetyltransferase|nr:GNAT family N-acetyltransferase [Gammaproteobacteria bacterium]
MIESPGLRQAGVADLESVNRLIECAINTWDIYESVKRLAMSSFYYTAHDLDFLTLMVAEAADVGIVGIAAWEQACQGDNQAGHSALLLHGIYVAPDHQRHGIATRLLQAAETAAATHGFDGLLVKAQPGAEGFFLACGMERLAVGNERRDYPRRFWKPVKQG